MTQQRDAASAFFRGLAAARRPLGLLVAIGVPLFIAFVVWRVVDSFSMRYPPSQRARVERGSLRSLAESLERYLADHGAFPPSTPMLELVPSPSRISAIRADRTASKLETIAESEATRSLIGHSNSPPYSLPPAYWRDEARGVAVVWSPGPDWDYDLRPFEIPDSIPAGKLETWLQAKWGYTTALETRNPASSGDLFEVVFAPVPPPRPKPGIDPTKPLPPAR